MELTDKYPQLNEGLQYVYGDSYQLEQTSIDRIIQFVMTLSESEEEIKRKEVTNNDNYKKGNDSERDGSAPFRRSNKKFLTKDGKRDEKSKQERTKKGTL